ncbi:inner membrane-spanning protein YciB [Sphingomonas sp. BIUV-7]|uniref:Inner membrane-spanning protein YciB n=1 Tax=Sphingomonas natans TaxID=3063330 RepID=A0ABT8YFB4_9SPHN|nr:inner membrane-spanning protein YciB [Sphingomonas sp. BIUV-7]MDO6416682.1 inner membrane-spanning protein YciB [Sphingomonas sp. BIUV-7]
MSSKPTPAPMNPFVKLGLDLGPLIVFFAVNLLWPGAPLAKVMAATLAFMLATGAAIVWAKLRHGTVSAMLIVSGVMVLVFGGLTLWLHSETFIKIKPTAYYATVSAILFYGLIAKRPTLELVLGQAYPGLTQRGWTLLTRNWAFFFVLLGIANEAVWRNSSTSFWIGYKLWGSLPATLLFAIANVPMLMKHGLNEEVAKKEPPLPLDG